MFKTYLIGLTVLVILILAFSFYWYSYRPEQIRKDCYDIATKTMGFDLNYRSCMLDHGLNE